MRDLKREIKHKKPEEQMKVDKIMIGMLKNYNQIF